MFAYLETHSLCSLGWIKMVITSAPIMPGSAERAVIFTRVCFLYRRHADALRHGVNGSLRYRSKFPSVGIINFCRVCRCARGARLLARFFAPSGISKRCFGLDLAPIAPGRDG